MATSETAMRVLDAGARRLLERAVLAGRREASAGCRAALVGLGVGEERRPAHLSEEQARLRVGLRAKQRQLGGEFDVLVDECAYEQWHRLLFARFLAERRLLRHPKFGAPVGLGDCEDLASETGEPDGWAVAGRFAAEILPGIFRLEDPAVQLRLAPESRLALQRIVSELPAELFLADDALGWVYQYWQSERKDEVNASERKIGGRDLAPVTQLFTEHYMVRFLLENSLGAWWAARHPDSPLVKDFEYLRFDEDGKPAAGTFEEWPESVAEVTVMDPCCGSGHFLVEAFGMLWRMRVEEEGLDPVAVQDAVLRDNLFGLELDPRCVQIAMFMVALQAWKDGDGWRQLPIPNIACSGIPAKAPLEEWTALAEGDPRLEAALERLHALFKDADTLGSLIDPRRASENADAGAQGSFADIAFHAIEPLLQEATAQEARDPAGAVLSADAVGTAGAAMLLSQPHTLIATNVPYLKRSRQSAALADYCQAHFPEAKQDLAIAMFHRVMSLGTTVATVMPHGWLFMSWYRQFRALSLQQHNWRFIAHLGTGAFDAVTGEVVNVLLGIFDHTLVNDDLLSLNVSEVADPKGKSDALVLSAPAVISQQAQLSNPDSKVILEALPDLPLLSEFAGGYAGICSGDYARFGRQFWEMALPRSGWEYQQSTVKSTVAFGGRDHIFFWQEGNGEFVEFVRERLGPGNEGAWIRGTDFYGKWGVAVSSMGRLPVTLYTGELFDNNTAVILPDEQDDLPAIWHFARSPEFEKWVRMIDTSLKVTNATLVKVPFDVERWRQVAAAAGPLPEPWSDDPTQWLFEGRPEVATEPLQVAVGRLAGYRWPEQPESDDFDELSDDDGIVCLPSVSGEAEAAARLEAVLARALDDQWGPAKRKALLETAGSKKSSLDAWLRDDFFKHHCKVFGNRPFIWQVWDGRKDGFSALVNYHRFDRSRLNKLTYTYLGDWIERQRAQVAADETGAEARLAAALELQGKLELILEGEKPYDIYVRWKPAHEQPIGWEPDLDDGVRLNIRPFVEAGVLRSKFSIHWKKDRGKNPDGSERHNDVHLSLAEKRAARAEAGQE